MKTSIKVILIGATVGILGMAGLAKAVHAGQSRSLNAVVPQHSSMMNDKKSEIGEKSDGDGETNDDAQEASKLRSLAKITPQQAQQSAEESSQGAKASQVKLENENGNLVYAVTIGQTEVTVDAGNGKVLYTDSGKESDANEVNRPRSSIQASQSNGDGDGETNDDV